MRFPYTSSIVLALALGLVGCGSGETTDDGSAGGLLNAEPGSAAAVANEARGKVRCPARIATPAPAAGSPTVDVIGLRPGLTYDEAANLVLCDNPLMTVTEEKYRGFNIDNGGQSWRKGFTGAFAQAQSNLTPEQQLQETLREASARSAGARPRDEVNPGESRVYVATIGLPGQERVISASRRERYADGANPTMANVVAALTGKYGAPTADDDQGRRRVLKWAYDPSGRRILETSPYFFSCSAPANPDSGSNLSPKCGVVVQAELVAGNDNPDLAESLSVGVIDQAGGYRLLSEVEQAFANQDQARRAAEVERAAAQGAAPKL
ncbi:hypothetical protein ACO2Q1_08340 [Brevundimonas sp. VNH65]|uniref:hypothetical protein n=1 Tax=Brevundimonas sp. VNH65 TaxID=3400917 RepID=UPI003C09B05A